jgi:hypothetical protein
MKFNLVVEIDDQYINEFLAENPKVTLTDLAGQLNNACYLGLDCTNAIIMRQFDFGICETYVKKTVVLDKSWGEFWGDNFPTETECPVDVIEHHAQACDVMLTENVESFARAMWNEGNLTEKLA